MPIKRHIKIKAGFTLIELLAVISIIGLLTVVGIVAFTNAREKARLSRGLKFASEIYQALGAEAIGVWAFDEGSGISANDGSGYNNHGTLINSPAWSTDTPTGKGYSLNFNGENNYVRLDITTGSYGSALSVAAWVKHNLTSGWDDIVAGGCGDILFAFSNNNFTFGGQCNSPFGMTSYSGNISGAWHHVVGTFDGSMVKIYVDGKLVNSSSRSGSFTPTTLYVGSTGATSEFFNGLIDDVRLYSVALSSAQIKKYYAESKEKYKNLSLENAK